MGRTRSRWVWLLGLALALVALAREAAAVDLLVGTPTGRIMQVDGAAGGLEGIFVPTDTEGLADARGLALGPDGRLYVGTLARVYRFDASTGDYVDKFVNSLQGGVLHLVFAPDGSLFGTVFDANLVFRAAPDGVVSYIGAGSPLSLPTGIALGPDGNLYVGSWANNRVERFNPITGAYLGVFATVPGGVGPISFGPDGHLYVGLFGSTEVLRFDGTTGASLGSFIPPGDRHPANPSALAWGPDGNLYVSARSSGEVLRYDGTTGAFLGVFTSGLAMPWGLAFVPDVDPPPHPLPSLTPAVDTTSGLVQGLAEAGVRTYLGIPYAEAPVEDRRWKRPLRKERSSSTILALSGGPACPQIAGTAAVGSEDCLSLNLWRPDSPPETPPLPVLFYIHGGGLSTGSASGPSSNGTRLARTQNVIVVEPQYRLGALGFLGRPGLAAEDPNGSTGNYGFLDQLEALRWVRDNIAAFGGDPDQVTIAGQSAGGWSTCTLLASPLSDGLFRAAIVQSGQCQNARPLTLPETSPVLNDVFFGDTIYERGAQLATSTGCSQSDPAAQVACLRSAPASSLVLSYAGLPRNLTNEQPVNPAIDGHVLTEQPVVMLRQGAADRRALLIGSVANESTYYSQGWDPIITPPLYDTFLRAAAGNTRADALLPLYPAASYTPVAEAFRTLIEDTIIVCPTLDTADAATAGGGPAWVYHLTFPPTYAASTQAGLRTFHGLDVYYVFGTYGGGADRGILPDGDDDALSESMQDAWGSFVRTGVPSTTPVWPAYDPASVSVLQFDVPNDTVTGTAFRSGRCAAYFPVLNQLDPDRDIALPADDNCPTLANTSQADAEADFVGDVCDSCPNVANPRVAADFLTLNPWATLTGGQRDDDHDGYGNRCDAKFGTGSLVNALDLAAFRLSLGKSRAEDTCGYTGDQPCAIFDLDEASTLIGASDLTRFRQLNGKLVGPTCPTCPLTCAAGAGGSCD